MIFCMISRMILRISSMSSASCMSRVALLLTLATAWSKQHDYVASTIVGVTTEAQVAPILAAADMVLPDDVMKAIYKISREIMYPMG